MRPIPQLSRHRTPPSSAPPRASRRALAALTSGLLVLSVPALASPPAAGAAPAATPTMVLHYDFNGDLSGGSVTDSSGSSLNGTLVNPGSATTVTGPDGSPALSLPGGAQDSTTAPYVQIPNGLFKGMSQATISTWVDWKGGPDFQWVYNLGRDAGAATFLTPSFADDGRTRSSVKPVNGGAEVGVPGSAKLPIDRWVNVVTTLDGQTISYYINGVLVGSRSAGFDLAGTFYSPDNTLSGFLGKAFWGGHPFFAGALDDFRVYSGAMTADQVASLAGGSLAQLTGLSATSFPISTPIATAPTLPATIGGTYSDGIDRDVAVTWDAVDAAQYAQVGQFTVKGRAAGTDVTATVTVTNAPQVTVDLGTDTGDFMGGASGTLYGLYGQDIPSNNLIDGIKLRTVSTKAQDGPQHPGADALDVLKPLVDSSQGDVYIYMTDIYRGFPYQWPGDTPQAKLADFMSKMSTQVDQVLTMDEKYRKHVVFVPFNEPEGNMFGNGEWSYNGTSWLDNPQDYFAAWDQAYRMIKSKMPDARIAGPNTSILFDQDKGFLQHAVAANTVPDVMTWHELSDPSRIRDSVARYRSWEDEVFAGTAWAGKHLPININEYAFNYHTSVPGQMIQWISALEDSKVDGDIAYWNIDGNLSDSAVQANRGNGQWWLLNAYGQMTGHTVTLTPPNPNQSYTLQGVATVDPAKRQVQTIIGGAGGNTDVRFTHADPALLGGTAHVVVREIGWTGQIGDSAAPSLVKEFDVPVTDGGATVSFGTGGLPQLKAESAYQIILTPGANATSTGAVPALFKATYEAEDAAHTGTGWTRNGPEGSPTNQGGYYTSGGYDVGGIRTGSDVTLDFSVTVPQDGKYDLSIFANSLNTYPANAQQGPINAFVTVDGGAEQEVYLPLGYKFVVWDHTDTTVDLTAGQHTITLSARSLDGTRGTQGDAIVDKIDLSLPNPAAAVQSYEGEYATLEGGATTDYSHPGVSGSGSASLPSGGTADFWVYAAKDGESTLHVDALGSGSADLTVNGQPVSTVSGSADAVVFLSGGVNKIALTGRSGDLLVDRLQVAATSGTLKPTVVQAEQGKMSGSATVTDLPLADGGKAVTGIGGDRGNGNTLTMTVPAATAGTYALTVRYSNEEQSPATHYNPDPLARHADLSINGGATQRLWFPHSFHEDNFWELTFPVTLAAGDNTLTFSSQELPNFDGVTYASDQYSEPLRSKYAPTIDRIAVTPFSATTAASTAPQAPTAVTATAGDGVATVAWAAPAGDGGSEITGYTVTASPGGKTCSTTGETTCVVEGLTNGTSYTFTAVATNAVGSSAPSTASVAVTPVAPAPTVKVDVVSSSPASADGWYQQPVLLVLAAPAGSGTVVQSRVNGGAWRTNSRYVAVSNDGSTTVDYRLLKSNVVVDGSAGSTTVKIDKTAPTVSVLRQPSIGRGTPRNPIDVVITGADSRSGLARTEYRINGGDWATTPSGPVHVDQVGQYLITARSIDKAGNVSAERATTVIIDADPATTLRSSARSGNVGAPITFALTGYKRYDQVTLANGAVTWGTVRTDVNGTARITVLVPDGATTGTITAVGSDPSVTATVAFRLR